MRKNNAFGAIDLLLGLLITSIIFVTFIPMIKNVHSKTDEHFDKRSVEEQVNIQVDEIQKMRQQSIDANSQVEEP